MTAQEAQERVTLNLDQKRMEQDAKRATRSQERALAEIQNLMIGAVKPIVAFQTAAMKNWSDILEMAARNYEQQVEIASGASQELIQRMEGNAG